MKRTQINCLISQLGNNVQNYNDQELIAQLEVFVALIKDDRSRGYYPAFGGSANGKGVGVRDSSRIPYTSNDRLTVNVVSNYKLFEIRNSYLDSYIAVHTDDRNTRNILESYCAALNGKLLK